MLFKVTEEKLGPDEYISPLLVILVLFALFWSITNDIFWLKNLIYRIYRSLTFYRWNEPKKLDWEGLEILKFEPGRTSSFLNLPIEPIWAQVKFLAFFTIVWHEKKDRWSFLKIGSGKPELLPYLIKREFRLEPLSPSLSLFHLWT